MQHRQENGAFDRELETAVGQQFVEDIPTAGEVPEPFKDQGGSDDASCEDGELAVAVGRQEQSVLGEACSGGQEGIELSGLLELVEATESGQNTLPGAALVPGILHELEVLPLPGGFDAEKHGALARRGTMILRQLSRKSRGK
jgi:hypothetical protein